MTGTFVQLEDGTISTVEPPNNIVEIPAGHVMQAYKKALPPQSKVQLETSECDIIPDLIHNTARSIDVMFPSY